MIIGIIEYDKFNNNLLIEEIIHVTNIVQFKKVHTVTKPAFMIIVKVRRKAYGRSSIGWYQMSMSMSLSMMMFLPTSCVGTVNSRWTSGKLNWDVGDHDIVERRLSAVRNLL
jgi:hypothetical protein